MLLLCKINSLENILYKNNNKKNRQKTHQKTQTTPPYITKAKKKLCTSSAAFLTSSSSEYKHPLRDKQMALLIIKARLNPTVNQKREDAHVKEAHTHVSN